MQVEMKVVTIQYMYFWNIKENDTDKLKNLIKNGTIWINTNHYASCTKSIMYVIVFNKVIHKQHWCT